MISFLGVWTKFNFELKKKGYPCCNTYEDLNSISNLKKTSQTKYESQFDFELFGRKINFFMFQCCSTREDLSIDV